MSPETKAARATWVEVYQQTTTDKAATGLLLARAVLALERIAAALEHGRDAAEARDD